MPRTFLESLCAWKELSGRGAVYTYTIVHRPIAAGQPLPAVIAVITLADAGGVRMISNLVGVDPGEVSIGMPVELVWEDMSAEFAVPRFRPSAAAECPAESIRARSCTASGAAR